MHLPTIITIIQISFLIDHYEEQIFQRSFWKKAAQFVSLSFFRFRFVFELLAFFLIVYFFLIFFCSER